MVEYPNARDGYWEYQNYDFPIIAPLTDNVLDDFEDGDISEYGGETWAFEVQKRDVIQGGYSLKGGTKRTNLGDNGSDFPTPRGENGPIEYRGRLFALDDDTEGELLVSVQNQTSPYRNCYGLTVDFADNNIRLFRRQNGDLYILERKHADVDAHVEYQPFITLTRQGINGGIRDSSGEEITRTDSYLDSTFIEGGLGWRIGTESGDCLFDYATHHPGTMGDVSDITIDDFEDGNLKEYEWPSSSGYRKTSPAAAYSDDYGLEMVNYGQVFSLPGMGLNHYPRDGTKFQAHLKFVDADMDSSQFWIYVCPQGTHDAHVDGYTIEAIMDDYARIQRDRDGVPGHGTGHSGYAAADVDWKKDCWYRFEVELDSSEGIHVNIFDVPEGEYVAYMETYDTRYIEENNGIGFRCGGSGHMYVDEVRETNR